MATSLRLSSGSSGGASRPSRVLPSISRNSAPCPPTAVSRMGANSRSISSSERPLTSATAPLVRAISRARTCRSESGTRTSRGVNAMSTMVPSMSSRNAVRPRSGVRLGATISMCLLFIRLVICIFRESPSCRKFGSSLEAPPLIDEGERPGNRLERLALRRHAPAPLHPGRGDHQYGARKIAHENPPTRPGLDQHSEKEWPRDAPDSGPDRIEESDRKSADFEREDLPHREISGTGGRGGNEEDDHPGDRLRLRRQDTQGEEISRGGEEKAGDRIGRGDHGLAPDRVEKSTEHQGAEEIPGREGEQVPPDMVAGHAVEVGQDQRIGEENRVVEEGLRRHQGQPDQGSRPVGAKQRGGDLHERGVAARAQPDAGALPRRDQLAVVAQRAFDLRHDDFGFVVVAVRGEPARAFGDPHPHEQDPGAEDGADQEGQPPAELRIDHARVEDDERNDRAERGADPETAVDDEIRASAVARGDHFLDRRVDGGVFAADARAGQETEGGEAPQIPGQRGPRRRGEVDREGDEEDLLTPQPVREPAEKERPEDRAAQISAGRYSDLGVAEPQDGARLEGAPERAGQRDLEAVENPRDAQRHHNPRMEAVPWQAIETGRDIGLDHRIVSVPGNDRTG